MQQLVRQRVREPRQRFGRGLARGEQRLRARERGVALSTADLGAYRDKVERDRKLFGDCVTEVEPLTLEPRAAAGAIDE